MGCFAFVWLFAGVGLLFVDLGFSGVGWVGFMFVVVLGEFLVFVWLSLLMAVC